MTVDQNISSRINLMRIFLICGIVFVHVPHDLQTSPFLSDANAFHWLRVFLGDSFFRIGVPCLSAISGYLLFRRGMDGFDYAATLRSKFRTVLTPFLIWNLSLLALVLLVQSRDIGVGYFPDAWQSSARDMLNLAFATEDFPVNIPLYFLRDLFICILLSPVLAYLVRRQPLLTCAILFGLAILPTLTIGLVLKKSILFSFTFGICLALYRIDVKSLDRHAWLGLLVTVGAAALLATGLYQAGPDFPFWLDLARNALSIIGALGFWLLSALLIKTSFGQRLANTGSLSFWIFCAHYPLLVVLWMIWNRMFGDAFYAVFYCGALVTTFAVLSISNSLTARYLPSFYQVLTGSRGRKSRLSSDVPRRSPTPEGVGRPFV